eukprot:comp7505_c0_seq1/m.3164 comp7505_c0_seq1/g.3164  ORF comp7505_c0_seq1/g.3164 comp7505_c0_seq1/m.3164 type:complete len:509 (-) comp7505_c0_seq1:58-1584(-)
MSAVQPTDNGLASPRSPRLVFDHDTSDASLNETEQTPPDSPTTSTGSFTEAEEPRDAVHQAAHIARETWLVTKLAVLLLSYMGVGWRWIERFARLGMFVFWLLPAFLSVLYRWLTSDHLVRNVRYGKNGRNQLDIYLPKDPPISEKGYPVVVFFSGGAWIIGYKAWGALMGFVLSELGVMFVTPDYRNFPQGRITDMLEDVNASMKWVIGHCSNYGGDPDNIFMVGQSAGAHLSALALLTEAERDRREKLKEVGQSEKDLWNGYVHDFRERKDAVSWRIHHIRGFIGISGVYDPAGFAQHLHERGLYRSVLSSILNHDLSFYSPTRRVGTAAFNPALDLPICSFLPPITLLHGTADMSIPHKSTEDFAQALQRAGIHAHVKYYQGKTHTDPIIEDPIGGGYDQLVMDIYTIVRSGGDLCSNNPCTTPAATPLGSMHDLFATQPATGSPGPLSAAETRRVRQRLRQPPTSRTSEPPPCRNVDPRDFGFQPTKPMAPLFNIRQARRVNPF